MSPLQIKILLHYYCMAGDYAGNNSPAEKDAFRKFVQDGYLIENDLPGDFANARKYKGTEKLHVYCDAICKTPEPVQKWFIDFDLLEQVKEGE